MSANIDAALRELRAERDRLSTVITQIEGLGSVATSARTRAAWGSPERGVLDALAAAPNGIRLSAIARQSGQPIDSVGQTLSRLMVKGRVVRPERGMYVLSPSDASP